MYSYMNAGEIRLQNALQLRIVLSRCKDASAPDLNHQTLDSPQNAVLDVGLKTCFSAWSEERIRRFERVPNAHKVRFCKDHAAAVEARKHDSYKK